MIEVTQFCLWSVPIFARKVKKALLYLQSTAVENVARK